MNRKREAQANYPVESMQNFYGPATLYKAEWQAVRGSSLVTSVQFVLLGKHTYDDPLAEIDNLGPAKVPDD